DRGGRRSLEGLAGHLVSVRLLPGGGKSSGRSVRGGGLDESRDDRREPLAHEAARLGGVVESAEEESLLRGRRVAGHEQRSRLVGVDDEALAEGERDLVEHPRELADQLALVLEEARRALGLAQGEELELHRDEEP